MSKILYFLSYISSLTLGIYAIDMRELIISSNPVVIIYGPKALMAGMVCICASAYICYGMLAQKNSSK